MAEKKYIDASPIIIGLTAMKREYDAISFDGIIKALKDAPAADVVEVKHGDWIPHEHVSRSPYARNYDCSACGNSPIETGDYCNKCGAKMEGGERNELRRLHKL